MTPQEFKINCLKLSLQQERLKIRAMQTFGILEKLEHEGNNLDNQLLELTENYKHQVEEAFPEMQVEITSDFDVITKERENG